MTDSDEQAALARYERAMQPHRAAFANRHALRLLGGVGQYPAVLHLFLIHFAATGIAMTRPVESWIRRAGERCRALGHREIGDALIAHSKQEAGHHALMAADLCSLVERWNAAGRKTVDAVALARPGRSAAVRRYEALHEGLIAGDDPYAQIAVEYEIEALSVRYGTELLATGGRLVGDGLSFLRAHVAADIGHSRFNRTQLARFAALHPETFEALVHAGAAALDVYGAFLDECLAAALRADSAQDLPALDCALHPPPTAPAGGTPPEWLGWVRALRSQILYDDGRRPAFAPGGGSFGDPDPADFACWHFVLADRELPVGTIRLLPLDGEPGRFVSITERQFGAAAVEAALAAESLHRRDCVEASRLILHPAYRQGATVRRLLAGAWAFAAETGAPAILAAAGTRDRQDRLLAVFGARPLGSFAPERSERFGDEMRLMLFPVDPAAPPDYPEIEIMRGLVATRLAHAGIRRAAA